MRARPRRGRAQTDHLVEQLLGEMAHRLETNRPGSTITVIGRHALLQATTMDPVLLPALRAKAPDIETVLTRRQYAVLLRQTADAMAATPPVCCRKPMRQDGSQYVCDVCQAYTDRGAPSRADRVTALHTAADRDFAEQQARHALVDHRDDAHPFADASESAHQAADG
ncbi:hypothetical protein ACQEV9_18135 [Streptomyces chartreusis]|uniref:hypothetical protein n=1 Tax=Streptomyces chartreusis TaxID=1969 RepID=UPI003D939DEB